MSKGSQAGNDCAGAAFGAASGHSRPGSGWEAAALHVRAALLTDVFIVFAALLFSVQGLEIFLRARRVMKTAP